MYVYTMSYDSYFPVLLDVIFVSYVLLDVIFVSYQESRIIDRQTDIYFYLQSGSTVHNT
jgi:hypothetical protein